MRFLAAAAAAIGSVLTSITSISNSNGTGSTDVGVKVGVATADGSVSAGAKLWSLRTGLGGSEVEKLNWTKGGGLAGEGVLNFCVGGVNQARLFAGSGNFLYTDNFNAAVLISTNYVSSGNLTGAIMNTNGRIDQAGTDNSASPGAQTINKPIGKAAIAAGASSVVITNSLVTSGSVVLITPHARDTTCKELIAVPANGSFTVSGSANATAALPFSFEVKTIL